ncbi:MAG: flavodoxin [Butyrivibrio sp.]
MKIKRLLSIAVVGIMTVMALTGCTSGKDRNAKKTEQSLKSTQIETVEGNESKVLVVYYSASGNTKKAAEYIAAATGGDMFELVPTEVYSSADLNWSDKNSRVSKEHDDPDLRDVELEYNTVDNWDSYDTVFIGYPIWWGIAAWPVNSFVQLNDFSGKTVIPFATSTSSGLGESGKLLEKQAGTGNWQDGRRFKSSVTEDEVNSWIQGLDL